MIPVRPLPSHYRGPSHRRVTVSSYFVALVPEGRHPILDGVESFPQQLMSIKFQPDRNSSVSFLYETPVEHRHVHYFSIQVDLWEFINEVLNSTLTEVHRFGIRTVIVDVDDGTAHLGRATHEISTELSIPIEGPLIDENAIIVFLQELLP